MSRDYDVTLYWRQKGEEKWQTMVAKTRATTSVVAASIALRSLDFSTAELAGMTIKEAGRG